VVEVVLGERERFLNTQAGAPQDDDHRSRAPAVTVIGGMTHDGHDLLDDWRVGRVAHSLVARRPTGVVARQGRRRATPPRGIQQHGHGTSLDQSADTGAALHRPTRPGYRSP